MYLTPTELETKIGHLIAECECEGVPNCFP